MRSASLRWPRPYGPRVAESPGWLRPWQLRRAIVTSARERDPSSGTESAACCARVLVVLRLLLRRPLVLAPPASFRERVPEGIRGEPVFAVEAAASIDADAFEPFAVELYAFVYVRLGHRASIGRVDIGSEA